MFVHIGALGASCVVGLGGSVRAPYVRFWFTYVPGASDPKNPERFGNEKTCGNVAHSTKNVNLGNARTKNMNLEIT